MADEESTPRRARRALPPEDFDGLDYDDPFDSSAKTVQPPGERSIPQTAAIVPPEPVPEPAQPRSAMAPGRPLAALLAGSEFDVVSEHEGTTGFLKLDELIRSEASVRRGARVAPGPRSTEQADVTAVMPVYTAPDCSQPATPPPPAPTYGVPVTNEVVQLAVEENNPAFEPGSMPYVTARDGSTVAAKRSAGEEEDDRGRLSALQWIGAALLAVGLAMFGWIGWQYFGTNITSNQAINQTKTDLKKTWKDQPKPAAPARPVPGDAIALMRIPALGDDYEYPIIAGTENEQLSKGIGWYTSTAQPGQIGNFAVAGHRITHGEPFAKLLQLKVGDKVIVETRAAIFTYALTTSPDALTVDDASGSWVLWPLPDKKQPGAKPTQAMMTITTCTDLVASPKRSVAFAKLVSTTNKN